MPYVCERFEGAFDRVFAGSGSIYTLGAKGFVAGQTSWTEELVSERAAKGLEECRIAHAWDYLRDLERQTCLLIARYPKKIAEIPEDDEDLVVKAAEWTKQFGERVMDALERDHPGLVSRVQSRL